MGSEGGGISNILPTTNSENSMVSHRNLLYQGSIFRVYVSFREGRSNFSQHFFSGANLLLVFFGGKFCQKQSRRWRVDLNCLKS